jgi:CTP:molybdopterin cytidylyltransferase MocA
MTVGAVIVADDPTDALADAAGRVAVRRIVEAAWAGGALPIIVVGEDAEGRVAASLVGSPASLVAGGDATGVRAYVTGVRAALDAVGETDAVLLWPARYTWVDPETVTSLIEGSGRSPAARRPERAGEPGWPVLLPVATALEWLEGVGGGLSDALAGRRLDTVDLGDPGTIMGREVGLDALPPYAGPPGPMSGPPPEWGAAAAEVPEPELAVEPDP